MRRVRLLWVVGALVLMTLTTTSARAENLNEKFGPSWDCSYITAGMSIYDYCKPCQDKGMDFWRDTETTGHCVPKAGAAEEEPSAPAPQKKYARYMVRVCNLTHQGTLYVAAGLHEDPADTTATYQGWWQVPDYQCKDLPTLSFRIYQEHIVYLHAHNADGKMWPSKKAAGTGIHRVCTPHERFREQAPVTRLPGCKTYPFQTIRVARQGTDLTVHEIHYE